MGENKYIEMDKESIKKYRKMFIALPPQRYIKHRVREAISKGIPLEFLVAQKIVDKDNVGKMELSEKEKKYMEKYMEKYVEKEQNKKEL